MRERGVFSPWRHRWAILTTAFTLALIFIGGLVTSTESALAVPDWPLSYGMLMPPMVGGIFFEHGHRMAAAFVGLLTLVLAVWTAVQEKRRGIRRLAWAALGVVLLQGLLGGVTVLLLLPTSVSVAHACLAQTFFCLVIALAYATSREWLEAPQARRAEGGLELWALAATGVVYVQLLVGAVMRHLGAGLAIPDFPLAFGRLVPPLGDRLVAVHFAHRVGALAVLVAVALLFLRCRKSGDRRFARPAAGALLLVLVQIGLGAATVLTSRAVLPTTAHVATGAAILGTCWFIALRALRYRAGGRLAPAVVPGTGLAA
jgi:cytochrome c oxidase assembly protein subunit 15